MTVTAVRHPTPVWTGAPVDQDRPGPGLTFTVQIGLAGTALPGEAAKVLLGIRALAEQVPDATVTMTPIAAGPSEVDSVGLWIEPASRVVVQDGRPVRLAHGRRACAPAAP